MTARRTCWSTCGNALAVSIRTAPLPETVDAWKAWKYEDDSPARKAGAVDMEERFCSAALDIIGRAVFDYDFESASSESPLVRAV